MIFELNDEQVAKYEKWKKTLTEKKDFTGIREYFIFAPSTVGFAVKVVCGEKELDLTDYDGMNKKK